MKVLLTATSYPINATDWRGRFIYDMCSSVGKLPDVGFSIWAPPGDLPEGVSNALLADDAPWLSGLLARGGIAHELRSSPVRGVADGLQLARRLCRVYQDFSRKTGLSVVHANWLQTALPLLGTKLPALVTVLGSDMRLLRLPGMVTALRLVFRGRKTILAPNAQWMLEPLQQHFGDVAEVRPIPFGIHPRWFSVRRDPLAPGSGDWLMVSRITRAKLGHLLAWGEGVFGGERRLHLFGPMQEELTLPGWITWHGPTSPEPLAQDWFPSVAGLLTLSTHDEGRPQVMIEAMAAGLPIIASDLPAHRDLLQGGALGRLVDTPKAFVHALDDLALPATNRADGERASDWVRREIGTWQDAAQRYCLAYRDLLP